MWTNREETLALASDLPLEYAVIDVETTGLKPSQQRIIEIAVIRVSSHGPPLRWSSLLNPGKSIPKYIVTLTGIDDQLVAGAPEFRSVAPTVEELVGDLPIVGHNASFDVGFVNAELARCGRPRLVNRTLDTLSLAHSLARETRRLNLEDVARRASASSTDWRAWAPPSCPVTVARRRRRVGAPSSTAPTCRTSRMLQACTSCATSRTE
jgi:DNA polymerase III epsilon subunit-like protein